MMDTERLAERLYEAQALGASYIWSALTPGEQHRWRCVAEEAQRAIAGRLSDFIPVTDYYDFRHLCRISAISHIAPIDLSGHEGAWVIEPLAKDGHRVTIGEEMYDHLVATLWKGSD